MRPRRQGFALVIALVLMVVITIGVVTFLSRSLSDRRESLAIANAERARQAAESACEIGIAQLQSLFTYYTDSATGFDTVPVPRVSDEEGEHPGLPATLFYYRAHPGGPGAIDPETPLLALPLCSGGQASADTGSLTLAYPDKPFTHEDNSVDLNEARFPGDTQGRLGSPAGERREVRVPWVELPGEGNRTIRIAWWMEDESFRLNLNQIGITPRGADSRGVSPSEIPLQGLLTELLPGGGNPNTVAADFHRFRNAYPGGELPEPHALSYLSEELSERLQYYTTTRSSALNLSRTGSRRVNLNTLVSSSDHPAQIRAQLDALLAPVRHSLPGFGQRFYPAPSGVPAAHAGIYLEKLAANLRDALTPDSQPTVVEASGAVRIGAAPVGAIVADPSAAAGAMNNPVIAIGKENVPYLQEYASRVTLNRFQRRNAQQWAYDFTLDHYFEFWNMGTKDISVERGDLGESPFLLIENLPGFDAGPHGHGISAGRSKRLPLPSDLVFPAGQVTVLTTDENPNARLLEGRTAIKLEDGSEPFIGITTLQTVDGKFRVNLIPRHTATTDYGTRVLLGNDRGHLESFGALPLVRGDSEGNNAFSIHNDNANDRLWCRIYGHYRDAYYVRGGSLRGNHLTPLITGDPRTNNEQLILRAYDPSGDVEQTRYYHSELGNPGSSGQLNVPGKSTLGAHNTNFVDPSLWPDPSPHGPDGVTAPMFIPDGPFDSIGQLGHLFDPARVPGPSGNIAYSRGGGRTLSIGQPDPLAATDPERAAWRLTDLFSVTDELTLPGRLNINGTRRDHGTALRALLHGFAFSSDSESDPVLAGRPLASDAVDSLLQHLQSRGPLMERGELSECLDFPLADGVARESLYDRGREELFRRMVELITTRGNLFTLYATGEVGVIDPGGRRHVEGVAHLKVTFELLPEWSPELPEGIDPVNAASRLRPPERFTARIVSLSAR